MNPDDVIDGKYAIIRRLGHGGMGAVYEARHGGTGRQVAVKVIAAKLLREEPDIVSRFQREARAAGAIKSQHVVDVLDSGFDTSTGHPYLVMEYLEGRDLSDTLEALGPLAPELALRITAQACLGLSRAHAAGIIHRDIKSANVFLAKRDEGEIVVKLLDFGIAKVRPDVFATSEVVSLTQSGSMLGSPHYMSPEQAKGLKDVDHRTDIWSLGIVLYEVLTGATPFAHCQTIGPLIFAIYSQEPKPLREAAPWVSPEIATVVHRALAREPSVRFQTAAEMLAALRALLPDGQSLHESQIVALPQERRLAETVRLSAAPGPASGAPGQGTATPAPEMVKEVASGQGAAAEPFAVMAGSGAAPASASPVVSPATTAAMPAASSVVPSTTLPVPVARATSNMATVGGVATGPRPTSPRPRALLPASLVAAVMLVVGVFGTRALMHRSSAASVTQESPSAPPVESQAQDPQPIAPAPSASAPGTELTPVADASERAPVATGEPPKPTGPARPGSITSTFPRPAPSISVSKGAPAPGAMVATPAAKPSASAAPKATGDAYNNMY